jgi:hypothetical protein
MTIVYPPQLIIEGREVRAVRVNMKGENVKKDLRIGGVVRAKGAGPFSHLASRRIARSR